MTDRDNSNSSGKPTDGKDFLQVFKRGVQFTEELLKENERLRVRLIRLEEENRALVKNNVKYDSYKDLVEQINSLDEERGHLLERFRAVEVENQDYQERYREIEEENNRLANLYIASYQLHSTLDLQEVVRITCEIIINLVGALDFCLYFREGNKLVAVRAEGHERTELPDLTIGKGMVGRVALEKSLYISGDDLTRASVQDPKVCIPLVVEGKLFGMVAIFAFLAHKPCITELDRELFNLLGQHAATALYSARLRTDMNGTAHDALSVARMLDS